MARTESFTDQYGTHEYRVLETADDVTPEVLEAAERCHDDWFDGGGPIDWEDFLDRLADPHGFNDAGAGAFEFDQYDSPAVRKIQRHVRKYRSQG